MVEEIESVLLNGVVLYSLDWLETSVRSRLTSDMFFKSLQRYGTLRCHSGINELDESLQGRSIPPLLLPDCLEWASVSVINRFRARGGMEISCRKVYVWRRVPC